MSKRFIPNLEIEGAKLMMKNFSGIEKDYNPAGQRNFAVKLDPELAEQLREDGWPVKTFEARNDDESAQDWMKVKVVYDKYPPKVYMISGRKRTLLDEDTVGTLDHARIVNCDLTINPSYWEMKDGRNGITAYLKEMHVTIEESRWDEKYSEFDDDEDDDLGFK